MLPGNCAIATALQGVQMPILSDSECSSKWGSSFQASSMICVFSGSHGACNVSLSVLSVCVCVSVCVCGVCMYLSLSFYLYLCFILSLSLSFSFNISIFLSAILSLFHYLSISHFSLSLCLSLSLSRTLKGSYMSRAVWSANLRPSVGICTTQTRRV